MWRCCTLLLTTYGCELGCKNGKSLQLTQSIGTRRNLGPFRSGPISSLEKLKGPLPTRIRLQWLGHARQRNTLGWYAQFYSYHPTVAILDRDRKDRSGAVDADTIDIDRVKVTNQDTNNSVGERFDFLNRENKRGARFGIPSNRILYDLSHPLKSDEKDFKEYVQERKRKIEEEVRGWGQEPLQVVFTDGSATKKDHAQSKYKLTRDSGAAFTCWHRGQKVGEGRFYAQQATNYEAELLVVRAGVCHTLQRIPNKVHSLIVYADSEAALTSALSFDKHPGQGYSIAIFKALQDWFYKHPTNHITFAYCPGHQGISQNEEVDRIARDTSVRPISSLMKKLRDTQPRHGKRAGS
ncbi:hypothetical protein AX16_008112 [Volvariella volvacea WC 439]|nr:hypothetical protein AX16_008112 [Volvariella volvacea WC 439]